jgi:dihydropyrimidinase
MRVDHSIYEGRTVRGAPELVLARGRTLVERGRYVGPTAGGGAFVRRTLGGG